MKSSVSTTCCAVILACFLVSLSSAGTADASCNNKRKKNGGATYESANCDFEIEKTDNFCGWEAVQVQGTRWIAKNSTATANRFASANMTGVPVNYTARLVSPWFRPNTDRHYNLSFKYYMGWTDNCQLSVLFQPDASASAKEVLWKRNTTGLNFETTDQPINLPASPCQHRVIFEAKKVSGEPCEMYDYQEVDIDDITFIDRGLITQVSAPTTKALKAATESTDSSSSSTKATEIIAPATFRLPAESPTDETNMHTEWPLIGIIVGVCAGLVVIVIVVLLLVVVRRRRKRSGSCDADPLNRPHIGFNVAHNVVYDDTATGHQDISPTARMEPLGSTSSEYQEIPYGDTTSHDLLVSDPIYQNTGSHPSATHYRDHDIVVGAGRLQSTTTPGSQRPKTALKPKTTLSMPPAYRAPPAKTGAGIYEHLTPRDETNQYTSLTGVTKPETAQGMSKATAHGATQGKAGAGIYEHVKPSMEPNQVYTSLARVKKRKR